MTFMPDEEITSQERLREIIPFQDSRNVLDKDLTEINDLARSFIDLSPFAVISTKGCDGQMDVSPRGDPAGSILVHDSKTLLIGDRLGNQRADTFENILHDNSVGILFIVPGHAETLRVAGRGRIVRDAAAQTRLAVNSREPELVLAIDVEQVFMHCAKAFVRSALWRSETWPARGTAPSLAQWVKRAVPSEYTLDDLQGFHDADAENRLY